MNKELKKLLELAGTLDAHVSQETKLFREVCGVLTRLEKFCVKQRETKVYDPIVRDCNDLCDKLTRHLDRYK